MTVAVAHYRVAGRRGVPVPRLRLVLVADLHACTPHMPRPRIRAVVDQANGLGGDLVLLLGDYVGHILLARPLPPEEVVPELARLAAPLGVWAVFGNHDWEDDPHAQARRTADTLWHRAFAAAGLRALCNAAVTVEAPAGALTLAGLDSQRAFRDRRRGRIEGVDDLDAIRPALDPARLTLLMAHEPDIFPDLPGHVDLTVAGHMHRGQIAPFGRPLLGPSKYGTRFAYGHHAEGEKQLVVSGGLGCSLLPWRIGAPPELTVVDLE